MWVAIPPTIVAVQEIVLPPKGCRRKFEDSESRDLLAPSADYLGPVLCTLFIQLEGANAHMTSAESVYRRSPQWLQTALLNVHAWRIGKHRFGPRLEAAVNGLLERERWPASQMRSYQDERIRAMVLLAHEKSPYYRKLMAEVGVHPTDIRGAADLPKLPLLTKETIRSQGEDLLTERRHRRSWVEGHTSGTTGSPLALWYDRETCVMTNAVDYRQKRWAGMGHEDWIAMFLGRVVVPPQQTAPPFWRANVVHRQLWCSSFHLSGSNLEHYVDEIRRRGIRFLEGYPSTLYIIAKHLTGQGRTLPMQAVFSSSETLHTIQREAIETAFGCPLFDFYGHAERVLFATECEYHAGKHLSEEFGYCELVDEDGQPVRDGETGYLVGTSLHNTAMPMLRYRTGDLSALEVGACPCGRTSRRIRNVTTKAEDTVVTPDGRLISPSILTHPFKPFDQIIESQIIQTRIDHLLVKVVPSAEFTDVDEQKLIAGLRERLGPEVHVQIERVTEIPREASGKFRWVISHVDHSCRVRWQDGV